MGHAGAGNSVSVANIGLTVSGLAHTPVVPAASNAVTISALLKDPDNVQSASLFYRVASGGWLSTAMTLGADGRHSAAIPVQTAGALVQFYVRGTDALGAVADFPAGGAAGGAFYRVANGDADLSGVRGNLRVLISPESETTLFTNTNRMSNDTFAGTIIEDERTVYYGCRVKLKGSAFGRYAATEFGYILDFLPEQTSSRSPHSTSTARRPGQTRSPSQAAPQTSLRAVRTSSSAKSTITRKTRAARSSTRATTTRTTSNLSSCTTSAPPPWNSPEAHSRRAWRSISPPAP